MTYQTKSVISLLLLIFTFVLPMHAQNGPAAITADQRKQANTAFIASEWEKAAVLYQTIADAEPQNPNALYRLGYSLHKLKKYTAATSAYERSAKISVNPTINYNLACIYSVQGEKETALKMLDQAIVNGFANIKLFQTDPDLDGLRNAAGFNEIAERVKKAAAPCEYDPNARQFDFWVGDWDVKTQTGQTAGSNKILKVEDGCILIENWTGAMGGTGKSINFFDKQLKKWRQIWVDNAGNSTNYVGEFRDGSIRYESEITGSNGAKVLLHLTFTPIDSTHVRQYGERSTDDGKTWAITFDLVYGLKTGPLATN